MLKKHHLLLSGRQFDEYYPQLSIYYQSWMCSSYAVLGLCDNEISIDVRLKVSSFCVEYAALEIEKGGKGIEERGRITFQEERRYLI